MIQTPGNFHYMCVEFNRSPLMEDVSFKLSWYWKLMIVCFALTLGLLTVILIPPLPNFSVAFAKSDLTVGLAVTNSAAAAMAYHNITAVAFLAGEAGDQPLSAVCALTPFRQSAGELSRVWFQLRYDEDEADRSRSVYSVVMRARASYGGAAWPWKEIEVTVVCDGVRVPATEGERKCEVDGVWVWREILLFVGLFVLPFLVYVWLLYYQNFLVKLVL